MLIEDFITSTPDWEQVLAAAPYCVRVVWDGEYFLLKYSQLESDFSNEIVQQCRGSIFKFIEDKCVCVCRPFRKFFNVQEANAAEIDWSTAKVQDKIDGSIMKVWCDNSVWHLSTNGTIDAFKAEVVDGLTFGAIFERAAHMTLAEFCKFLSPCNTYIFELTSPESQVVIPYSDGIYWLATKDTRTEREVDYRLGIPMVVKNIKRYPLFNLHECLRVVSLMDKDKEGFVVVDKKLNRVKIKSTAYVMAHHAANNGVITYKHLLNLLQKDGLDDFIALCPKWIDKVNEVLNFYRATIDMFLESWWAVDEMIFENDKEFAAAAKNTAYPDYCFAKKTYGTSPEDYFKRLTIPTLLRLFEKWKESDVK